MMDEGAGKSKSCVLNRLQAQGKATFGDTVGEFAASAVHVYNPRMPNLALMIGRLFLAVAVLPAPSTLAQNGANVALTISEVRVSGQNRFRADQVLSAIGLKAGDGFLVKGLNRAAERLGKSGVFEEVSYTYTPNGSQVSVEFTVKEVTKFRKCIFDNFVWVSDEELDARLRRDLPLYTGELPENGAILDEVSRVLEKLSQEQGVATHVDRRVLQASIPDLNWSHLFVAEGLQIKMQAVTFAGALTVNPKELEKDAAVLVGKDYSMARCFSFRTAVLIPYYHDRGYLRANAEMAARIVSHAQGSSEFSVEAIYNVTEGNAYRWAAPEWKDNQQFAAADLETLTGMKPESLASERKIEEGWEAVRKAYARNGYFEAKITTEPVFDERSGHVHYVVTASEGAQYHMGSFQVTGLPQKAVDRLKSKWRLKAGDIFDASYASEFWKQEAGPSLAGVLQPSSKVNITTLPNKDLRVVDVTFQIE